MIGSVLLSFGMLMLLLGFALVAVGILAAASRQQVNEYEHGAEQADSGMGRNESSGTEVKGGGAIMIGPIPIVFGTDRHSAENMIILAIILMLLTYLLFR